jgi:hypothetical protein
MNVQNKNYKMVNVYNSLLGTGGLIQIINESTRVTNNHVTNNENIVQNGTIPFGFSDHKLVYCSRKIIREQIGEQNIVNIGP